MSWVGIDDTDSPAGGCTTHAFTEVCRAAHGLGLDLLGEPRRSLRLNPNVPFKTRGNAALAGRFGHGRGRSRRLGALPDGPLRGFLRGDPPRPAEADALFEAAWATLDGLAPQVPGTDPALVVLDRPPPVAEYWRAVQSVVDPASTRRLLEALGGRFRTRGSPQGLVGATAAVAWSGRPATWELIAYRDPARSARPRRVSRASVARAEQRFPELFLCSDPRTRRLLVTPHTPCPILFGLRARRPDRLPRALDVIESEPVDRWIRYRTNQGSGDHLARRTARGLAPFLPAVVEGRVSRLPERLRGGHVAFELRDGEGGLVACVAFEPTKTLPKAAAALAPGDRVRAWGGVDRDTGLKLEGLEVLATVGRGRGSNPRCPRCGGAMKSLGAGRGFRCPRDRSRAPPEARAPARPGPAPALGRYDPTPSARRHLHPPLPGPEGRAVGLAARWRRRPRTDL